VRQLVAQRPRSAAQDRVANSCALEGEFSPRGRVNTCSSGPDAICRVIKARLCGTPAAARPRRCRASLSDESIRASSVGEGAKATRSKRPASLWGKDEAVPSGSGIAVIIAEFID
jgi:hypothetical protein